MQCRARIQLKIFRCKGSYNERIDFIIIMQALNEEQRAHGLSELSDLTSLAVKASIFEPNDKTRLCATQRCALVSLFDSTRTVFAVEPVVNLQQLSVSTLQQSL